MPSSTIKEKSAKSKKDSASGKKSSKVIPASKSTKSSERITESDRDSETSSDETSSDDASDSDELPEKPTKAPKEPNGKKVAATESSSESGSEDGSSDESSEEETSDGENATTVQPPHGASKSSSNTVRFQPPAPFKPPHGFELASKDSDDNTISNMFSKSNLAGKEIWYITAPASVPASAITKISIEHSKGGISHNGKDYAFIQDNGDDKKATKLLIPSGSAQDYSFGTQTIKQTIHLQQVVDLPNSFGHNGSIAPESSRATVPKAKPVRQQPGGLKMRFKPIGFGNGEAGTLGDESDEDAEMADAPAQFRAPKTDVGDDSSKKSKKSKKSKHADSDDESKKSKKDKSKKKRKLNEEEAKSSSSTMPPTTDNIVLKHKKNQHKAKELHIGQEIPAPVSTPRSTTSNEVKQEPRTTPILPPMRKSSIPLDPFTSMMKSTPVPCPRNLTPAAHSPSIPVITPKCTPIPPPQRRPSTLASPAPFTFTASKAPSTIKSEDIEKRPKKSRSPRLTLEERINAIDPSLSKSERKVEVKRLKAIDYSQRSQAKRRASLMAQE